MKTRSSGSTPSAPKRGRPSKFGRPSQVIAVTLPEEVIRGLGKIHHDLGWAIVQLFERTRDTSAQEKPPDFELVSIAERRALIAVNKDIITALPGVDVMPPIGNRAFLAVAPEHGMAELELAVIDRLDNPPHDPAEQKTMSEFRKQLRAWRHDGTLRFHTRGIIVVERTDREEQTGGSATNSSAAAQQRISGRRILPPRRAGSADRTVSVAPRRISRSATISIDT